MTIAAIEHIVIDDRGIARIAGSRSRVIDVVLDQRSGLTPDQIVEQYPHLGLAQVHAALSYYYDHRSEIDATIERQLHEVERLRAEAGEPPLVRRLRSEGKLS